MRSNCSETGWAGAATPDFSPSPCTVGDGLALENDFLFLGLFALFKNQTHKTLALRHAPKDSA